MVSRIRRDALAFTGSCVVAFLATLGAAIVGTGGAAATLSRARVPMGVATIRTTAHPATSASTSSTSIMTAPTMNEPATVTAPVAPIDAAATKRKVDRLDTKTACVYAKHDVRLMQQFGRQVGRTFDCALVYNNAAPGWSDWVRPWFVVHGDVNFNWATWATAQPNRTLIISQSLIPKSAPRDWRQRGAAGEYDAHVRSLGTALVGAGLGDAIVRLAFESNGPWMIDALGKTRQDRDAWRVYWRRFVTTIRTVPGANFEFDWTVNAGYQALDLASYYPGDDVVDIIGVDAYDSSVHRESYASPENRWDRIAGQPGGLFEVLAFAKRHHKPLSLPEWGLAAVGAPMYGAGDNATYVNGIAAIIRSNRVRYHSYFLSATGGIRMTFDNAPISRAAYRRHFGAAGDAIG